MAAEEDQARELLGRSGADPSALTTAALLREISTLKAQFEIELAGEIKVVTARLDAIDRATDKFESSLTRVPTETQQAVSGLKDLHDEKFIGVSIRFDGVQTQFEERDVRVEQTARDTRVAVDAALQAAEKAVGKQTEASALSAAKSEAAFSKQADQQAALVQSTTGALRDQVEELRGRVTRIEAIAIGQAGQKTETHSSSTFLVSIISIGIAVAGLIFALLTRGH